MKLSFSSEKESSRKVFKIGKSKIDIKGPTKDSTAWVLESIRRIQFNSKQAEAKQSFKLLEQMMGCQLEEII